MSWLVSIPGFRAIFNPDLTEIGVNSETAYPQSPVEPASRSVLPVARSSPLRNRRMNSIFCAKKARCMIKASRGCLVGPADFSHVVSASTDHTLLPNRPAPSKTRMISTCGSAGSCARQHDSEGGLLERCGATLGYRTCEARWRSLVNDITGLSRMLYRKTGRRSSSLCPDPDGPQSGEDCPTEGGCGRLADSATRRVSTCVSAKRLVATKWARRSKCQRWRERGTLSAEPKKKCRCSTRAASTDGSKVFFVTDRVLTPALPEITCPPVRIRTEDPEGERLKLAFQEDR